MTGVDLYHGPEAGAHRGRIHFLTTLLFRLASAPRESGLGPIWANIGHETTNSVPK
jgi:hypothetical protein